MLKSIYLYIYVIGMSLMFFTVINKYIILLLIMLILVSYWISKKKKTYKFLIITLIIALLLLILNYFLIEPRINSINYLTNKYDISRDKIKIKKIDFICKSGGVFSDIYSCISVDIEYKPYQISVIKTKKGWEDYVTYKEASIKLEMKKEYINENNIDVYVTPKQQLKKDIVDIFEKYNVEYKRYNYDKYDTNEYGDYYYIIKITNTENLKRISLDIKHKLKEFYENFSNAEGGSYRINIYFTKSQEVYNNYVDLISLNVENSDTILEIKNYNTINNDDFHKFNELFSTAYEQSTNEKDYDFVSYGISIIGNAANGLDSMISDEYGIYGVKIVEE